MERSNTISDDDPFDVLPARARSAHCSREHHQNPIPHRQPSRWQTSTDGNMPAVKLDHASTSHEPTMLDASQALIVGETLPPLVEPDPEATLTCSEYDEEQKGEREHLQPTDCIEEVPYQKGVTRFRSLGHWLNSSPQALYDGCHDVGIDRSSLTLTPQLFCMWRSKLRCGACVLVILNALAVAVSILRSQGTSHDPGSRVKPTVQAVQPLHLQFAVPPAVSTQPLVPSSAPAPPPSQSPSPLSPAPSTPPPPPSSPLASPPLASPPSPQSPRFPSHADLCKSLNDRFENAHPSNSLWDAGVLVRQFDSLDDQAKPWLACPKTGNNNWCHSFSDRWATSIISPKARMMYYGVEGIGGFVLAPTAKLFCACARMSCALN